MEPITVLGAPRRSGSVTVSDRKGKNECWLGVTPAGSGWVPTQSVSLALDVESVRDLRRALADWLDAV